jgi:hypothetical protein
LNPSALVAAAAVLLVGAPLLGVWLAGEPVASYLEFPPRPRRGEVPGFAWMAFWLLVALVAVALMPFVQRMLRIVPEARASRARSTFPIWGWAALLWLAAAWVLAWTRFPWFDAFQQHTFAPLWLGYIALVSALTVRRQGSSLLTRAPLRFAALFPLSALFWWFFEYLNRFVGNWYYAGIAEFGALEYTVFATLSFSTVLPAVASTAEWLNAFPRFQGAFARWHSIRVRQPRLLAAVVLLVTVLSLIGLGTFREYLYPLVWISPGLLVIALQALAGRSTVLAPLAHGDWRGIVSYSAASLLCGFFWEMWNFASLARWGYNIPYVDAFRIFEMPVLGYAGYVPFGIECAVIIALVLSDATAER